MRSLLMKKGFTIIELLIVITVIAILIGIALPRFRGMQEEGNTARAHAELRTLQTAVESYLMHQGSLPTSLNDLIKDTTKPNLVGTVLPTDPFTNSLPYTYTPPTTGTYYIIYSVGPSGEGSATVGTDGKVTVTGDAIWASNGTV